MNIVGLLDRIIGLKDLGRNWVGAPVGNLHGRTGLDLGTIQFRGEKLGLGKGCWFRG